MTTPQTLTLKGDVVSRVERLPKPSNAANALQPIFEAISNAYHAIDDKFSSSAVTKGRVTVTVDNHNSTSDLVVVVEDNGIGLDDDRFEAFCTTDTSWKMKRGGKGVGRLLWLDMFEKVHVKSVYKCNDEKFIREFDFLLDNKHQIKNHNVIKSPASVKTGTVITFSEIRDGDYATRFPVRAGNFVKHFGSHFFSDFILQKAPVTTLSIGGDVIEFPEHVLNFLVEDRKELKIETEDFGVLTLRSFICDKAASSDLDGDNQLHYIANDRTVISKKIDGLIGFARFGQGRNLVFHGCVSGDFLDKRVNQERTNFTFTEAISKKYQKLAL